MKNNKIKADKIIFSRRRTLGIQIDKDAQIVVRAPIGTSSKKINDALQKHKNWIKRGKEIFLLTKSLTIKFTKINCRKFLRRSI